MLENPNIGFLFDGIVKYAHRSVQGTYSEVLKLEEKWKEALRSRSNEVFYIKKLIGLLGSLNGFGTLDPKRRNEIFRYFSAASI